jgi:hypothetical protein
VNTNMAGVMDAILGALANAVHRRP